MRSVHETLIVMLFFFFISVIAMISFVTPEDLFLGNEFPWEGLALKPSNFMEIRDI